MGHSGDIGRRNPHIQAHPSHQDYKGEITQQGYTIYFQLFNVHHATIASVEMKSL
jgi:hypothetical protein